MKQKWEGAFVFSLDNEMHHGLSRVSQRRMRNLPATYTTYECPPERKGTCRHMYSIWEEVQRKYHLSSLGVYSGEVSS